MPNLSRKLFNDLQNKMEEKAPFNEEVIFFRSKENLPKLVEDVFKGLEFVEGIRFVKCEIDTDRKIYKERKQVTEEKKENKKGKARKINHPTVNIEESRFIRIKVTMELSDGKETIQKEIKLLFPELLDQQYFLINGNEFFPVFQMNDSEYYRTNDGIIVLKTMFMPIKIKGKKVVLSDIDERFNNGEPLKTRALMTLLFKKTVNVMNYYFAGKGVVETLRYFNIHNYVEIVKTEDHDITSPEYYFFQLTKSIALKVNREWIESDQKSNATLIATLVDLFKYNRIDYEKSFDSDYWKRKLGSVFTNNNSMTFDKAISILSSFERLLDNTTRSNLRLRSEDKEDIYAIVRNMITNYYNILKVDNHSLSNKRLRVNEYLFYDLTQKLSKGGYRLVGPKNNNVSKLKTLFSNIKEDYLVNNIPNSELVRFSNNVNSMDLFTRYLKGSVKGPQSATANGLSVSARGIYPSFVGKIDLVSTSSGDPGSSFTVVPFCKKYDPNNSGTFFFEKKPDIEGFLTDYDD
ncbi:hypothetical protein FPHOBKDP_00175 [Listeria phage LPJP1]|nr:hypothetical protein FPHOBKDP_00175 [Listeria phage LPJP1]